MIDWIPYIGIVIVAILSVCLPVFLKKNGIFLTKLKHRNTELEFAYPEQISVGVGADTLDKANVPETRVEMSSDAMEDCKTLSIPYEEPIQFVLGEAERHPLLFQKNFTSVSLILQEDVRLLLSWEYPVATIERILNRSEAYPLNDDWNSCYAAYRKASILPYRIEGPENLRHPAGGRRALTVYRRLVSEANKFLDSLRQNQQRSFEVYRDLSSLLTEAKFALENEDLATAAARFEILLSTVHKLIVHNAPQGPFSTRGSAKTAPVENSSDVKGTILLVDDEERWLDSMRRLLQSKNFAVIAVKTTSDALRALVDHEFDLVITDLVMGVDTDRLEADGREVVLAAKKGSNKTKAIVLTAYSRMSQKAALLKSGVDVIIFKTESTEEIMDKIDSTLTRTGSDRTET